MLAENDTQRIIFKEVCSLLLPTLSNYIDIDILCMECIQQIKERGIKDFNWTDDFMYIGWDSNARLPWFLTPTPWPLGHRLQFVFNLYLIKLMYKIKEAKLRQRSKQVNLTWQVINLFFSQ